MKTKPGSWISHAALCLAVAFLPTCGGGGGGTGDGSAGTGSVSVQLQLNDQQTPGLAQIDCARTELATVEAEVYDEANTLLASGGPWACTLHQGTISNVPGECNLRVVALATGGVEAPINYLGESAPFCVTTGATTSVEVMLRPFNPPSGLSPTFNYCFSPPCSFTFSWSSGWERHEFELDNTSDFSSPLTSAVVNGTSCQASVPGTGTYYWRVRATDSTGNHQTGWAQVTFVVSP